jgi:NADPH2:quinone reductase
MATLPERMMAIDPAVPGEPDVLVPVERAVPLAAPGEVLIKVAAAGVNRPDVMQRQGLYPPPKGAPTILGLEVAGEVVAIGQGVDESWLGKPVCALVSGGGYADYCAAPAGQCLPVPDALTMVEAAAMPETLFTVWTNLFERGGAKVGDTVLVHGGTSGIGSMAILLGQLFGLQVIVTAGSNDKCARAREMGAALAINYREQDFVAEVQAFTSGRGVAAVLDMVGGDYVARNIFCLAEEGRHVSIAAQRGAKPEIPVWQVMAKRLVLTGSTLRARDTAFKSRVAADLAAKVWPYVAAGDLKPVVDAVFPLEQAAEAHRRMEEGSHVGKIVLTT